MNRRLPNAAHKLRGTFRRDRHGASEEMLTLPASPPEAPAWLSVGARAEFQRVTIQLADVLSPVDLAVVAQYCVLFAELAADPAGFTAAKHTQLRLCAGELGLTPASRSRVRREPMKAVNEFAQFQDPPRWPRQLPAPDSKSTATEDEP